MYEDKWTANNKSAQHFIQLANISARFFFICFRFPVHCYCCCCCSTILCLVIYCLDTCAIMVADSLQHIIHDSNIKSLCLTRKCLFPLLFGVIEAFFREKSGIFFKKYQEIRIYHKNSFGNQLFYDVSVIGRLLELIPLQIFSFILSNSQKIFKQYEISQYLFAFWSFLFDILMKCHENSRKIETYAFFTPASQKHSFFTKIFDYTRIKTLLLIDLSSCIPLKSTYFTQCHTLFHRQIQTNLIKKDFQLMANKIKVKSNE